MQAKFKFFFLLLLANQKAVKHSPLASREENLDQED